jgi:hypothetical protein
MDTATIIHLYTNEFARNQLAEKYPGTQARFLDPATFEIAAIC